MTNGGQKIGFEDSYRETPDEKFGDKYFKKDGKRTLATAIEIARAEGVPEELIEITRKWGFIDGNLDMSLEEVVQNAGVSLDKDFSEMFDSFDPIIDHDLISTGIFCLFPEVMQYVENNSDALYKGTLATISKGISGHSLPIHPKTIRYPNWIFSPDIQKVLTSLPESQTEIEKENQRRLKLLIDKKVERETFSLFRKDPDETFKVLEEKISTEENPNLREAYQRLFDTYKNYGDIKIEGVNPNFVDPNTGEKGVLPSLHQCSAIYHLMREKRLGIFDGCGTGKTAIPILASRLIEEKIGRKPKALVVVGTKAANKAWEKGLVGDEDQRYLEEPQNILIVDKGEKDLSFMRQLDKADWVIINDDQLITKVNGGDNLFVDKLKERGFDFNIFDEAHHLKTLSETTKKGKPTISKAAQNLTRETEYVSLLTATPIPDRLDDYGVLASILQPEKFPTPKSFIQAIRKNPRVLYTFLNEKSVRRSSDQINEELDWEEMEELVQLTPIQRKLYNYIERFCPGNIQARKALLDPRLVDPKIQKNAGVLGKIGIGSSAKYQRLEELLGAEDGPIALGDKFIIFSSMFKEGVTQPEHLALKKAYQNMGEIQLYNKLQLSKSLDKLLSESLSERFGKPIEIGVIDGTINEITKREKIVEELSNGLAGILCTTDTGGESQDFTAANYIAFLDEDYTPTTPEQALRRAVRKGQKKKVKVVHLRAEDTMDEDVKEYVNKKRILVKIAMDGHPLTQEEWVSLEDLKGKGLKEITKRRIGGISINTNDADIQTIEDFGTKKITISTRGRKSITSTSTDYDTTDALEVRRLIGQDPINCWKNPEFVELYMKALPSLSIPVIHKAKISDLIRRSNAGEIVFPRTVLSDGSGPSLLWSAYQGMKPLVNAEGYKLPTITDRDFSPLMLEQGENKRQVVGNMNGENSEFKDKAFKMVDNESITLLANEEEVKKTLLESHRILKDKGLLELVVKNVRFPKEFYSGMERLGYELVSDKNQGFYVNKEFLRRLEKTQGEHFAKSYASKLSRTYMLLARKVDKPDETAPAKYFWFEHIIPEGLPSSNGSKGYEGQRKNPRNTSSSENDEEFKPKRKVVVDKSGVVQSVKDISGGVN